MIVLDTHIWIWWVHGDEHLTQTQREIIAANEDDLIGVSQSHVGKLPNSWSMGA